MGDDDEVSMIRAMKDEETRQATKSNYKKIKPKWRPKVNVYLFFLKKQLNKKVKTAPDKTLNEHIDFF